MQKSVNYQDLDVSNLFKESYNLVKEKYTIY